jgi:hypothetical protein
MQNLGLRRGGTENSDRLLSGDFAQIKAHNAHLRSRRYETNKKESHGGI